MASADPRLILGEKGLYELLRLARKLDAGRDAVVLTFRDWPDLSEAGENVADAMVRATDRLSDAVYKRIEARAPIPNPSDFGPRDISIVIADEVAAKLEGYLEERQARMFREAKEIQQANDNRRMAYLTDFGRPLNLLSGPLLTTARARHTLLRSQFVSATCSTRVAWWQSQP